MTADLHLVGEDERASRSVRDDRLLDAAVRYPPHGAERRVGPAPDDLATHVDRYGPRPSSTGPQADALLDTLQAIALTGRGGGHFPSVVKWRAALRAGGGGVVVANGAEGEPASAKDAALLQLRPHLVLDGLVAAAEVVGADDLVVWLHRGAHASHRSVTRALAERRAAGLREPHVRVVEAPDHYLSGESSAIVRGLSGGPVLPRLARRPAAVDGVGGAPTLVHNAETLARVGLAARTGEHGYRPTTLVTVVTATARDVVEVEPATTLGALLGVLLDGSPPVAVLLGGYGGSWVPWQEAVGTRLDEPAMRAAGVSLGAGVVAPLGPGTCGLRETAAVLEFLAASSARQCGPCVFGLDAMSGTFLAMAAGRARRRDVRALRQYATEVDGRGACHHPDGAVRLVRSALRTFADELRLHGHGGCSAVSTARLLPVPAVGAP